MRECPHGGFFQNESWGHSLIRPRKILGHWGVVS